MKIGDLVKLKHDTAPYGFILRIDKDYYGARQAFKRFRTIERGKAFRSNMVDGIGPTRDGIQDRVLVDWIKCGCEYVSSGELEVVSES